MKDIDVTFKFYRDSDEENITLLMNEFYTEDIYVKNITTEKIKKTFHELKLHPEKGDIFVAEDDAKIIGYALLINYWSNEFGGNILYIDELFIQPAYRGKGIGTKIINYIIEQKINAPVAIQLEVTKQNKKGIKFYKKFGFAESQYNRLIFEYK
ncbi:MAG: GNAT family N-acetyltransferase [Euryarchaeota archaeon]|nr:GNAT family N-acetyltransferase [Euryarchaeota archaeon]